MLEEFKPETLEKESQEQQDLTSRKREAIDYINLTITQVSQLGANDYEIPTLRKLIKEVEDNEKTPEIAKEEAYIIISSKQDYH